GRTPCPSARRTGRRRDEIRAPRRRPRLDARDDPLRAGALGASPRSASGCARLEPRRRGPPLAADRAAGVRALEPGDPRRRPPAAAAGRGARTAALDAARREGSLPLAAERDGVTFGPRAERDACGIGFVADARGRASRELVDCLLEGLHNVRHRGATAADGKTGDGAGVLLPLRSGGPGLAMVFLRDDAAREAIEAACRAEEIDPIGWRQVPVDALGEAALATMPRIEQLLLRPPPGADPERQAFRARRRAERTPGAYIASLSFRTVTYKALCAAEQLA